MEQEAEVTSTTKWSRRKKDRASKGVYRRPNGVWAIRFTCGAGHLHKERVGKLKGDAEREHDSRRLRAQREAGWCPVAERQAVAEAGRRDAAKNITVRQWAEKWLKTHVEAECRERTREQYESSLKHHVYPLLGDLPLVELKRWRLKEFFATKTAAGLARRTLKNIAVPLSAMLNAAVDEELIPGNPAARLWRHRRGRTERDAKKATALAAEELSVLLAAADEHVPDYADVLYTLAWSGLRVSEVCGLQWGDIDFNGRFLHVNRTATYRSRRVIVAAPKSGKARRVYLPAALTKRLQSRQSVREAEAVVEGRELVPWAFPAPTDDTKPMNAAFLRFKVWYKLLRRSGLRAVRIHDLRHTYASLLLQNGEPIIYVKEQLGHSSIQVTVDLYGHIRPGENRDAVDRLAALTTAKPAALARN
jgi:integrase